MNLTVGTLAALILALTVVAPPADARRTVIDMSRVKGKARARASNHCAATEVAGWVCIKGSIHADDCRRQSLQRPDVGWCWSSHVSQDKAPGPMHNRYYLFQALTWGQSIDNKIRWKLLGWSATRLPDA